MGFGDMDELVIVLCQRVGRRRQRVPFPRTPSHVYTHHIELLPPIIVMLMKTKKEAHDVALETNRARNKMAKKVPLMKKAFKLRGSKFFSTELDRGCYNSVVMSSPKAIRRAERQKRREKREKEAIEKMKQEKTTAQSSESGSGEMKTTLLKRAVSATMIGGRDKQGGVDAAQPFGDTLLKWFDYVVKSNHMPGKMMREPKWKPCVDRSDPVSLAFRQLEQEQMVRQTHWRKDLNFGVTAQDQGLALGKMHLFSKPLKVRSGEGHNGSYTG